MICWTYGSDIDHEENEAALDRPRSLRQEIHSTCSDLDSEIDDLQAEKQTIQEKHRQREQAESQLEQLEKEIEHLETTTIYVTHDHTEAIMVGNRIAALDGGRLQQVGAPTECYRAPANLFIAGSSWSRR